MDKTKPIKIDSFEKEFLSRAYKQGYRWLVYGITDLNGAIMLRVLSESKPQRKTAWWKVDLKSSPISSVIPLNFLNYDETIEIQYVLDNYIICESEEA